MPKRIVFPDGKVIELDWEKIAKELDTFRMNNNVLAGKIYELTKEYPDQWVAVSGGEIFIAPTQEELIQKLGDKSPQAAMAFLDTTPRKFILAKVA